MNGEGGMLDGLRQVVRENSPVRRGFSTHSRNDYAFQSTNDMCPFKLK